jgi:hypothetical protein
MKNTTRTWQAAAVVVMVAATASVAAAGDVRPLQSRGARLLEEGMRRSESMSALVADLRKTDVVVYVDLDPNEPGALEGSLRFRGAAAGARFVRVWLQPRRCDKTLMAVLAHELRHALEVGVAPEVQDAATFKALYSAVGRSGNAGRYETDAAQEMGERVRRELGASK